MSSSSSSACSSISSNVTTAQSSPTPGANRSVIIWPEDRIQMSENLIAKLIYNPPFPLNKMEAIDRIRLFKCYEYKRLLEDNGQTGSVEHRRILIQIANIENSGKDLSNTEMFFNPEGQQNKRIDDRPREKKILDIVKPN